MALPKLANHTNPRKAERYWARLIRVPDERKSQKRSARFTSGLPLPEHGNHAPGPVSFAA
jgi:hypothetical protein